MNIKPATIRDVLRIYWIHVWRHPVLLSSMLISLGLAVVLSAIYPIYYKDFFDFLAVAPRTEESRDFLLSIVWTVFAIHFLEYIMYRSASFFDAIFTARIMANLRTTAFEKLMPQSYGFFTNMFAGALVQKVNRLSTSFQKFHDRVYWHFYAPIVRITSVIIVLAFESLEIMAMVASFIVSLVIVNMIFAKWKIRYDIKRSLEDTHTTATLADAVTNNDTIRLFHGYEYEKTRFGKAVERLRRASVVSWILSSVNDSVQALLFVGVLFVVFFFGTHLWYSGSLTLGVFILTYTYYTQMQRQLWEFPRTIRDIAEGIADAKEMVEIINLRPEILDTSDAAQIETPKGEIQFSNVSFWYIVDRPVFEDMNLSIKAGERVAFVGPSGAGKSTLVRLLLRLHDVRGGSIHIDGRDIRAITQQSLRTTIAFVPQDPILFHRSLFENMKYGNPHASDEAVYEASRLAHCHEFISALPHTYETLVGERGVKLSGGERQRVAIARVIVKNAPILILDEATSSLDSKSERYIQDALEHLMKGKTTIAIAHRLSTIRKMDRIIVLDQRRIVQEGSHDELLSQQGGLYARLWSLQSGGFLV